MPVMSAVLFMRVGIFMNRLSYSVYIRRSACFSGKVVEDELSSVLAEVPGFVFVIIKEQQCFDESLFVSSFGEEADFMLFDDVF